MIAGIRFLRAWLRTFAGRCISIGLVLAVMASACLGQLTYIQLLDGRDTALAATQGRTWKVAINAKRGRILDANGTVLAQSVERYNVIGVPQAASEFKPITCTQETKSRCHQIDGKPVGATGAAAVARLVSSVLGTDPLELGAKLNGTGQYLIIKKDVTPETMRKLEALHLDGIIYGELTNERVYSGGTLLGPVLGGMTDAGVGASGLEATLNKTLDGTDGYEVYQRGLGGEEIPGTLTESKDAVNGSDVKLTIDSSVDWYVKNALLEGKKTYNAAWAIAVVLDLRTGRIIALEDTDQYKAGTQDAMLHTSRAVSEVFEPGSIGKVFTMSAQLQLGLNKITDRFSVPDHITASGQNFSDSFDHGTERWTLAGILQNSSNVGMIMSSQKLTNQQRYEWLTKFGIGQMTGLNLPGESAGILTNPASWDLRTQNTVLFGQGYATNALQLTDAVATIGNKGVKPQMSIIDSVTDAKGHVTETKTTGSQRVVDEKVASQMLDAMESVAEHYSFVKVPGYRVAAKTGTAQVAGPDGQLTSIISDWSGIIPADNPRFVVTVVMKDPQGTYGGLTAGPVFAKIGEFLMQKYEVPASQPRRNAIPVEW